MLPQRRGSPLLLDGLHGPHMMRRGSSHGDARAGGRRWGVTSKGCAGLLLLLLLLSRVSGIQRCPKWRRRGRAYKPKRVRSTTTTWGGEKRGRVVMMMIVLRKTTEVQRVP